MSQDALGQLKHLKTARARWPFPDVVFLPLQLLCRARNSCPHPSGRRGAGAAGVCSGLARTLVFGPTSLKRGEGPIFEWMCVGVEVTKALVVVVG